MCVSSYASLTVDGQSINAHPAMSTPTLRGINQRGRSVQCRNRRKTKMEITAMTATTNIAFHCGSMLTVV